MHTASNITSVAARNLIFNIVVWLFGESNILKITLKFNLEECKSSKFSWTHALDPLPWHALHANVLHTQSEHAFHKS